MTTDLSRLPQLLSDLYRTVKGLEEIAPGRRFTPDGHLVGSIGEAVAAYAYNLVLERASTKGFDAKTQGGREVQIKLTQGRVIAISHNCQHLLVLRFDQAAGFVEVYNGPGQTVWDRVGGKDDPGRQRQISVTRLSDLQRDVAPGVSLIQVRDFPAVLRDVVAQAELDVAQGSTT